MSRECFFEKMGTGVSSLEIFQEPEVRKDQLKLRDLKYLGTFWRLILICIFDGDSLKLTFFDGWRPVIKTHWDAQLSDS